METIFSRKADFGQFHQHFKPDPEPKLLKIICVYTILTSGSLMVMWLGALNQALTELILTIFTFPAPKPQKHIFSYSIADGKRPPHCTLQLCNLQKSNIFIIPRSATEISERKNPSSRLYMEIYPIY